jgi:hypothetical protein
MQTSIANKAFVGTGVQANKPCHGVARRNLTVRAIAAPPKLNTKRSEEVSYKVKIISLMQEFIYVVTPLFAFSSLATYHPATQLTSFIAPNLPHSYRFSRRPKISCQAVSILPSVPSNQSVASQLSSTT